RNGPSAWWPRTACPTRGPPGTSGATTASSSRPPPSRTGSRRPGKKTLAGLTTTYLDEALTRFSGYLAIDELYTLDEGEPACTTSHGEGSGEMKHHPIE